MKRAKTSTVKHNRLIAEIADNDYINDLKERAKAADRKAKEESLEYRIEFAAKKCIQNIHPFEAEYKKLSKSKASSEIEIEKAKKSLLLAIDKAAADSIGRIIAEIKQPIPAEKNTSQIKLVEVNLSVEEFYSNFENFCKKEVGCYYINSISFNKIIEKYLKLNSKSLYTYGERYDYIKPAKKFEENLKILEQVAVKEQELSIY